MTEPLILAFVGSFIAILSIFRRFLISRKDKAKRQVDKEIIELDRELTTQRDLLSSSDHNVGVKKCFLEPRKQKFPKCY